MLKLESFKMLFNLHSTVVLLKLIAKVSPINADLNLHSTVVLLKRQI